MSDIPPAGPHARLSVAIIGSGGSGALTTGRIFLKAVARCGSYGMMMRSVGPQIRGGESLAMIRFGPAPVDCLDDRFDVLASLDWLNAERFADEIPLGDHSVVLYDGDSGEPPACFAASGAGFHSSDLKPAAAKVAGGRPNMVMLGALGVLCGIPPVAMEQAVDDVLGSKGAAVVRAAHECIALGYAEQRLPRFDAGFESTGERRPRWDISGNEACGLGALRGGVRFVAAYPITPASEMLEWLAPRLEQVGGSLLQAEDELASVNMIVGASFGGVPALTATSGPGLSLMTEGMGLAVASETPVTVVNVMRGGPSTGIPTKSEQADLNIALHGLHGDAPHLVLAPLSVADCAFTTQWAVQLAEHLQTLAIVLSDQLLGQSRSVCNPSTQPEIPAARLTSPSPQADYRRYALSSTGISMMTLPGIPDGMYTADGLEHDERGTPSSKASDHEAQMAKRLAKIERFDYGEDWADVQGDGDLCLVTWGSTSGVAREAGERLCARGHPVTVVAMRLVLPLVRQGLQQVLESKRRIWVVEQNHSGQLFHFLNGQGVLPPASRSVAHPGPLPIRPGEVVDRVLNDLAEEAEDDRALA